MFIQVWELLTFENIFEFNSTVYPVRSLVWMDIGVCLATISDFLKSVFFLVISSSYNKSTGSQRCFCIKTCLRQLPWNSLLLYMDIWPFVLAKFSVHSLHPRLRKTKWNVLFLNCCHLRYPPYDSGGEEVIPRIPCLAQWPRLVFSEWPERADLLSLTYRVYEK